MYMHMSVDKEMKKWLSTLLKISWTNGMYMNDYIENDESIQLMYIDKDNLYGEVMSKSLSTSEF